ncbi:MAG: glutamine--fructose-6-phosphate aminotransferase, partial [Deltaproteobacteria bacterium]
MCGIVGYVGDEECASLLVDGLRKLEYRGYDSAGLAVLGKQGLSVIRAKGKLQNLENRLRDATPQGATGIGHTRWATHGKPSDENAHPHKYEGVAVVHNGIIENHLELKEQLIKAGHKFSSETDTEIFAHLIHVEIEKGLRLPDAVRAALRNVKGTYALAVVSEKFPDMLVVSKNASPLVVGLGQHCNFVASDVPAILAHTRDVIYLEEGDFAVITKQGVELTDNAGHKLARGVKRIDWTPTMA